MDTLHTVLRAIRGETKTRDHLHVFREFLGHLDRAAKRSVPMKRATRVKARVRKSAKR